MPRNPCRSGTITQVLSHLRFAAAAGPCFPFFGGANRKPERAGPPVPYPFVILAIWRFSGGVAGPLLPLQTQSNGVFWFNNSRGVGTYFRTR